MGRLTTESIPEVEGVLVLMDPSTYRFRFVLDCPAALRCDFRSIPDLLTITTVEGSEEARIVAKALNGYREVISGQRHLEGES